MAETASRFNGKIWTIIGALGLGGGGTLGGYVIATIKAGETLINHEKRIEVLEIEGIRLAKLAAERGEIIKQAREEHEKEIRLREKLELRVDRIERTQIERTPFIPKKMSEVK
jgi:hypothetical protein